MQESRNVWKGQRKRITKGARPGVHILETCNRSLFVLITWHRIPGGGGGDGVGDDVEARLASRVSFKSPG